MLCDGLSINNVTSLGGGCIDFVTLLLNIFLQLLFFCYVSCVQNSLFLLHFLSLLLNTSTFSLSLVLFLLFLLSHKLALYKFIVMAINFSNFVNILKPGNDYN